jgi:hypothetical protein
MAHEAESYVVRGVKNQLSGLHSAVQETNLARVTSSLSDTLEALVSVTFHGEDSFRIQGSVVDFEIGLQRLFASVIKQNIIAVPQQTEAIQGSATVATPDGVSRGLPERAALQISSPALAPAAVFRVLPEGEAIQVTSDAAGSGDVSRVLPYAIISVVLSPSVSAKSYKDVARQWVLNLVDDTHGAYIRKCVPQNHGRKILVHLQKIPVDILDTIFIASLSKKGSVERWNDGHVEDQQKIDESYAQSMQTTIQSVGNVQQTGNMISTLAAIRGSDTSGNASKRRRFADQGMQAFAIAQRVAASKLKEAHEDKIPDDE